MVINLVEGLAMAVNWTTTLLGLLGSVWAWRFWRVRLESMVEVREAMGVPDATPSLIRFIVGGPERVGRMRR
jgi:hypothetical protein